MQKDEMQKDEIFNIYIKISFYCDINFKKASNINRGNSNKYFVNKFIENMKRMYFYYIDYKIYDTNISSIKNNTKKAEYYLNLMNEYDMIIKSKEKYTFIDSIMKKDDNNYYKRLFLLINIYRYNNFTNLGKIDANKMKSYIDLYYENFLYLNPNISKPNISKPNISKPNNVIIINKFKTFEYIKKNNYRIHYIFKYYKNFKEAIYNKIYIRIINILNKNKYSSINIFLGANTGRIYIRNKHIITSSQYKYIDFEKFKSIKKNNSKLSNQNIQDYINTLNIDKINNMISNEIFIKLKLEEPIIPYNILNEIDNIEETKEKDIINTLEYLKSEFEGINNDKFNKCIINFINNRNTIEYFYYTQGLSYSIYIKISAYPRSLGYIEIPINKFKSYLDTLKEGEYKDFFDLKKNDKTKQYYYCTEYCSVK
jgi:hypothetical protein